MSITSAVVDPILNLNGPVAYVLVAGLAFAEAGLLIGFVLPGETAVILGGVLAYQHSVSLPLMLIIVVIAAIAGDSCGYQIGKRWGEQLLRHRIFAKHQKGLAAGQAKLLQLGGRAVFFSRFTAFLRAVTPGLAGTVGMPYRTFLIWNAAGGIVWGTGLTLLGYSAGASWESIESYVGRFSYLVLSLFAVAGLAWFIRSKRKARAAAAAEVEATDGSDAKPLAIASSRSE